ncbi:DUF4817 domain-containing protein [Trichonephila clavipes]|nr:DUF4817 domain-containing protein [Trichonephila clavipes]
MHQSSGVADCNGRVIQWLYAKSYPRRLTPSHAFFARLYQRLLDRGFFVMDTPQERERKVIKTNNEETVMDLVWNNLGASRHHL